MKIGVFHTGDFPKQPHMKITILKAVFKKKAYKNGVIFVGNIIKTRHILNQKYNTINMTYAKVSDKNEQSHLETCSTPR